MPSIERKIVVDTTSILKVVAVIAILGFLYLIRDILALVFAALFLTAVLNPITSFLEKKKIPKGVTIIFIYLLMIAATVAALALLFPPLIQQSTNLVKALSRSWGVISGGFDYIQEITTRYGLTENFQSWVQSAEAQLSNVAAGLVVTVKDFFGGLVGLVLVLVMAYYMVAQEEEAGKALTHFVPREYQPIISTILRRVQEQIGRWLIGQLTLCLVIGVLYFIGLTVIGIDSALILAVFGGLTEVVPYLGPILGAIPIVLIALSVSPFKALLAGIVIFIIQQAENHILVPKIMERAVGLNPLVSIVALLVGAQLFGVVGALLSIPVATALSVVVKELYHFRQQRLNA